MSTDSMSQKTADDLRWELQILLNQHVDIRQEIDRINAIGVLDTTTMLEQMRQRIEENETQIHATLSRLIREHLS